MLEHVGGRLSLRSDKGQGATVEIALRLVGTHLGEGQREEEPETDATS